jgi:hypothetical protein
MAGILEGQLPHLGRDVRSPHETFADEDGVRPRPDDP